MLSLCFGAVARLAGTWAWEGGRHRGDSSGTWGSGRWSGREQGLGWRVRTPSLCPQHAAVREGSTLESPCGFRGPRGALRGPHLAQTSLSQAQGSRGASGKRVGPAASGEAWGSEGRKEQTCAYQGAGCAPAPESLWRAPHTHPPPASFLWTQWQGEGAWECHVTPRATAGISAERAAACGAGGQVLAGRALVGAMVGTGADLRAGTPSPAGPQRRLSEVPITTPLSRSLGDQLLMSGRSLTHRAGCFSVAVASPLAAQRAGPAMCGARAPGSASATQKGPIPPGDQEDGLWPRQDKGVGCPRPRGNTEPPQWPWPWQLWEGRGEALPTALASSDHGRLTPLGALPRGIRWQQLCGAQAQTRQRPPQRPWPRVRPCAKPSVRQEVQPEGKPLTGSMAAIPPPHVRP